MFASAELAKLELINLILVSSTDVKVPDSTFELTPPPVKYLTVIVVFEGAIPYVFVNTKFNGENAVVS